MAAEYTAAPREAFTLPSPETRFCKSTVEQIIREVCELMVGEDRTYVFEEAQPLIKELSAEIQQRVVRLGYDRYKLVTHVVVTEAAQQGMRMTARALWDPETDNYASYNHSNEFMHVCVVVYAAYWE